MPSATLSDVTSNTPPAPQSSPPPPPQANAASQATPAPSSRPASQGPASPQTDSGSPQSSAFLTRLTKRLYKDLSPLNVLTTILATTALLYGAKSYNEAARANDLATRESCRQHPVSYCTPLDHSTMLTSPQNNTALQATSICQSMRKALDFDRIGKREVSLLHLESLEWPQRDEQWTVLLEPFLVCIILACLWRAATLVLDEGYRPASLLGLSVSRLLLFLLLFGLAWSPRP
jgi:hypothetical protein